MFIRYAILKGEFFITQDIVGTNGEKIWFVGSKIFCRMTIKDASDDKRWE